MKQLILDNDQLPCQIEEILRKHMVHNIFFVCTRSFRKQLLYSQLQKLFADYRVIEFSDFSPNPQYESIEAGVNLFRSENCDFVIAAGGGSALDVAKCIKLFSNTSSHCSYMEQEIVENDIPLLCIPTTAGAGSEATRFAVIYFHGTKYSVSHDSCIPQYVILEPLVLETLPVYHKKATMLDALCHAIESCWSVHSNDESDKFSRQAIELIMRNKDLYLTNDPDGNKAILEAANIAGRAINITQTTAGHAMAYKLTSLYGIAHGHAVALCVNVLWQYMVEHPDRCIDQRRRNYIKEKFAEISTSMGCESSFEALSKFRKLLFNYELLPYKFDVGDINSVILSMPKD